MDKNQILDQLKQINYPGFNRDIVSFGMVKDVVIDQSIITIILSISSSNEEKKNQLVQEISDKIKIESFEVKIKFWTKHLEKLSIQATKTQTFKEILKISSRLQAEKAA